MILADLHIGQAGTADGLKLLLSDGKIIDLGEDLFQTVFVENMCSVHSLNHLAGSLALTEAGDHDVLAGLQISLVDTGLHELLIDLDNNSCLIAISLNALDIHNLYPPNIRPSGHS